MKRLKNLSLLCLIILLGVESMAQELPSKTKVNWSVDVVNRHLWRGKNSGTAPSIEPTLEIQKSRFTFGAWGAYTIDKSYEEVDLYVTYDTPLFQLGIYDFYCPNEGYKNSKVFDFDSKNSVHIFDATTTFKGTDKFPISIMASVLFYGEFDKNEQGDQRYSAYLEFGYSSEIANKQFDWAIGITPYEGMYADGLNVVNMSMTMHDKIKFSDTFQLPIKAGVTLNPVNERLFFTLGFTLKN